MKKLIKGVSIFCISMLVGCESAEMHEPETELVYLEGGTFPAEYVVLVTPDIEAAAMYVRENLDSTIQACDFDGAAGLTFEGIDNKPGIIWLESARIPEDVPVINHELLHATLNTMRYSGVSLSDSSEEAYAYQFQYYSNQFYNKIK